MILTQDFLLQKVIVRYIDLRLKAYLQIQQDESNHFSNKSWEGGRRWGGMAQGTQMFS